jgi:hypothetical protein
MIRSGRFQHAVARWVQTINRWYLPDHLGAWLTLANLG